MKTALLTIVLITSQIAFGQIKNSANEARHQTLIEDAIQQNCGRMTELTQIGQLEIKTSIDQGITDVTYTTLLTGSQRYDQVHMNQYEITVESTKADMYDHTTKNWGAYGVTSASCVQK